MNRLFYTATILIASVAMLACSDGQKSGNSASQSVAESKVLFGMVVDNYNIERKQVEKGETWGKILNGYGIGTAKIAELDRKTKQICPLNRIQIGRHYTTLTRQMADSTAVLDHLVYEKNRIDYVVFSFVGDSVAVREGKHEVTLQRQKRSATIESSLWGAIMQEGLPYSLAAELEDIYQWTVDFFGIQKGDSFTVIYNEKFIGNESIGIDKILGAKFVHAGKEIYAIPFEQGGRTQYWEADGGSLRKQLLKAPLKFTRISSKFSNSRMHPVLKVRRPHHGVDYAAPSGTPVYAVADGVVTTKRREKAAGNMLKIKHAGNLASGYLHLRGYAKGIKQGSRVTQGQVIGYVGSTGYSTGPHLDFRIWKNGSPIDPLKIPQKPAEPISKGNMAEFAKVRDAVMAELNGTVIAATE